MGGYARGNFLVLSADAPLAINEVKWMADQDLHSILSSVPDFFSFRSGVIVWHSKVSWLFLG